MLRTLSLFIPILIPSWRFFQAIEPSPRVEWAPDSFDISNEDWAECKARPPGVSPVSMLRRLFWNPSWNEYLFMVSCAERLMISPTDHSVREISQQVAESIPDGAVTQFRFRLIFVERDGDALVREESYRSDPVHRMNSAP